MKSINIDPILNKHDLLYCNSWINTTSSIEYLNEYHLNEFKNLSFAIIDNEITIISVISYSKNHVLSFFDNSVQVIESPKISSDKINEAYKFVFKKILEFKNSGFIKINFDSNNYFLREYFNRLINKNNNYQFYIDLYESEDQIKKNVRKSFKSLINWGLRNLSIRVFDNTNISKSDFEAFRLFHFKIAGKATRSKLSWDIQYKSVINSEGFLVMTYLDDLLVSGIYISTNENQAYYGVSVNDRDLMKDNKPIGHATLFTSIIESKKRGKNIFILGDYNDADDKNKNISNYKLGFTNRVRSVNSFTSHI